MNCCICTGWPTTLWTPLASLRTNEGVTAVGMDA